MVGCDARRVCRYQNVCDYHCNDFLQNQEMKYCVRLRGRDAQKNARLGLVISIIALSQCWHTKR